ncbi:MAG: MFS transporter [Fusobacteriaceae bacterium]
MIYLKTLYFLFYFSLGSSLLFFSSFFSEIGILGKFSGVIFSAGSLLAMVGQPFLGFLADKTKELKRIIILLMSVVAIISVFFFMYSGKTLILPAYIIYSIAILGAMPLLDSIAVNTHYSFGKIRLWGSIGFAAGAFVSGRIIEIFGVKSFLIVCLIASIFTVLCLLKISDAKGIQHEKFNIQDALGLLKNSHYVIFIIFSILIVGAGNSHNVFFSQYFTSIGGSMALFGTVVFLLTLSEVPFMNLAANLTKKYGNTSILIFAGAMCSLRWGLYYFFPSSKLVLYTFFIQGASLGVYFALASAYVKTIVPKKTLSVAMTSFMAAGTLGGTIIQFCSGFIIENFGIKGIYLLFLIISLIATAIFSLNKKNN